MNCASCITYNDLTFRILKLYIDAVWALYEHFMNPDCKMGPVHARVVHDTLDIKTEWSFTPWVLTSVITSFGVNIEWIGRDSTCWVA